jgi:hypothetical protein
VQTGASGLREKQQGYSIATLSAKIKNIEIKSGSVDNSQIFRQITPAVIPRLLLARDDSADG